MNKYEWLRQQVESIRTNPVTECVEWPFTRIPKGYGQLWTGERQITAHRAAYAIFNGIEPEHYVCHHCDNPPCFNPYHLYDGTPADNTADMVRRGRANGGDKKLTETHVQEIIDLLSNSTTAMKEIGNRFGVTHPTISSINTGKAWQHIPRRIPARIRQKKVKPPSRDRRCKLTPLDVARIIEMLKTGHVTQARIAQCFGVRVGTIELIKAGKTWKHIPRPKTWAHERPATILNDDQVIEIINLLDRGELTQKEIGQRFGVSRWAVKDIRGGRRWKHIPRPWRQ